MSAAIRVLFLEPSAEVTGGAIALLRLVERLDKRAFRALVVLGSHGPLVSRFRRVPGCRVLCRPLPAGLSHVTRFRAVTGGLAHFASVAAYALALRLIAKRWRADVVHSNGLKTHLLSVLTRSRRKRILLWHVRDLLAPSYMPSRTAALMRALVALLPDVAVCNSESSRAVLNKGNALVRPLGLELVRPSVHTVFDGVDSDDAAHELTAAPQGRRQRVLMLGRIAEWKGQHVFIRAAARLCETNTDTDFIIAGAATTAADATYERQVRDLVGSRQLSDRIRFAGMVPNVADLLKSVDVLVHCSTSPEPFGLVIIEAMAAAVPVVATNTGGPAEIIRDDVNGRLYPAADDRVLAQTLREILGDSALRQRLRAAGCDTVRQRFSIDRTAAELAKIYRAYAPRAQRVPTESVLRGVRTMLPQRPAHGPRHAAAPPRALRP